MKSARLLFPVIILCVVLAPSLDAGRLFDADVRAPAVAGQFYPDSAPALRLAIQKFLHDAVPAKTKRPVAIVVPHAGYIFSGQICADGFKQVSRQFYDVVIILGTNHTSPDFRKVALYPGRGFRTPLGIAETDQSVISSLLAADPDCIMDKSVHRREHSVEVQVPFVQVLFPGAKIVPVVVGTPDMGLCTRFGQALAGVIRNRKALIVASSDLSHYPAAKDATPVDREILNAIVKLDPPLFHAAIEAQMGRHVPNLLTCACGEAPILAAMAAAKSLGATGGRVVSYAHSGDVSVGEQSRVVGYGAVVLAIGEGEATLKEPDRSGKAWANHPLRAADKTALLVFARETISRFLTTGTVPLARGFPPSLNQPQGVFVTLKKQGQLRGCIGHLMPDAPLAKLVGTMAMQAAFHDPRFRPVTLNELPDLEIEISALTPMKSVASAADIVTGRDGVMLSKDGHAAVFLPQVATEQKWGRDEMLDNLCRKAGLPPGSWKQGAQLQTFQAIVFSEQDVK